MSNEAPEKPFELFELCAACLLGLGAVGAALSGFQGGLWGGAMTDAYSESAVTNTKAASTFSDELSAAIQDGQSSLRAKELIWEAMESDDEELRTRHFEMASWIYLSQLSDPGYAALKLPMDQKKIYDEKNEDQVFSEDVLKASLDVDIDEDDAYEDALYAGSAAEFKKAAEFQEAARAANTIGDKFSLAGVILTIALFFAGLGLVFKTGMRWGFLGAGTVVFLGGVAYMAMLPWA